MAKIKMKIDDALKEKLVKVADAGGYSSPEEFILHVLTRELNKLDPASGESEENIRKKLEGLGYLG
ncbi:MAG TPA: hypothetical protein PLM22_01535 [Candidatus Sabulitectum sp.]|nr:hypothetical protein [Candidatus Sabulitectum sp.]HPF32566.1 hypothetical protein [Candidatus Sabulitectum sp.]HPJ27584.1 hypothetical protein [Candidatus Sabulitectum sp.]HPR23231.1 hypothetical protein [Candidatus Sabulitectum sp.]HRW77828.1 hypothetical protein [Candidatus Sabulitectum sp.]